MMALSFHDFVNSMGDFIYIFFLLNTGSYKKILLYLKISSKNMVFKIIKRLIIMF